MATGIAGPFSTGGAYGWPEARQVIRYVYGGGAVGRTVSLRDIVLVCLLVPVDQQLLLVVKMRLGPFLIMISPQQRERGRREVREGEGRN